jgi:hypothetical protein
MARRVERLMLGTPLVPRLSPVLGAWGGWSFHKGAQLASEFGVST